MKVAPESLPLMLSRATQLPTGEVRTTWLSPTAHVVEVTGSPGSVVKLTRDRRDGGVILSVAPPARLPLAPLSAMTASARAPSAPEKAAKIKDGDFYHSTTANVCVPDVLFACTAGGMVQRMLQNKRRARYVGTKVTASGRSHNQIPLRSSAAWVKWNGSKGNKRVQWQPSATTKTSEEIVTVSGNVGFNGFGLGINYPVKRHSKVSPTFPSGTSEPAFGARWTGKTKSDSDDPEYVSSDSVSVVRLARKQPLRATLYIKPGT